MKRWVPSSIFVGILFACPIVMAQSTTPATQVRTFHVKGTIKDSTGAAVRDTKVSVTFQNDRLSVTVPTNESGIYEADLPLGVYTMTVNGSDGSLFRPYRRPEFRVMSPINITLNATLAHRPQMSDRHGSRPAVRASDITHYDGDFFSIPSEDGVPFRLYISYVERVRSDYYYDYTGDNDPPYDDCIFAAYNLFSLRANKVHYDMESRKLEAHGDVVVEDESGQHRAYSMTFMFENGHAVRVP